MLIAAVLGGIVILTVMTALRFARMSDEGERRSFAGRQRKRVIFEGALTGRAAREVIPGELLSRYSDEQVKVTVERLTPQG